MHLLARVQILAGRWMVRPRRAKTAIDEPKKASCIAWPLYLSWQHDLVGSDDSIILGAKLIVALKRATGPYRKHESGFINTDIFLNGNLFWKFFRKTGFVSKLEKSNLAERSCWGEWGLRPIAWALLGRRTWAWWSPGTWWRRRPGQLAPLDHWPGSPGSGRDPLVSLSMAEAL